MSVYRQHLKNKKILLTCGPTWTPIDSVRVISNISSGKLGQKLAETLSAQGAKVTLLEGAVARPLKKASIKVLEFRYYHELAKLLKQELGKPCDIVIHAAAVSDYQVKNRCRGKMPSGRREQILRLVPTEKLIHRIKTFSPECFLVGFKLEESLSTKLLVEKAYQLLKKARCDLVVANSLKRSYRSYIIDPQKKVLARAHSRSALAGTLTRILAQWV